MVALRKLQGGGGDIISAKKRGGGIIRVLLPLTLMGLACEEGGIRALLPFPYFYGLSL